MAERIKMERWEVKLEKIEAPFRNLSNKKDSTRLFINKDFAVETFEEPAPPPMEFKTYLDYRENKCILCIGKVPFLHTLRGYFHFVKATTGKTAYSSERDFMVPCPNGGRI